jgi:hypothetical protein
MRYPATIIDLEFGACFAAIMVRARGSCLWLFGCQHAIVDTALIRICSGDG